MKPWVLNASPIITLAKVGQLALLHRAGTSSLVPTAVAMEIVAGPALDPARSALESGWGQPWIDDPDRPEVLEWGLGAGETSVLSIAMTRQATSVVDDGEARTAARVLGLPVIGTLGVVLRAKKEGRIASASTVMRQLLDAGLHIDTAIIEQALRNVVGEPWND